MRKQSRIFACSIMLLAGLSGFACAAEGDQPASVTTSPVLTTDATVVTRPSTATSRGNVDITPVRRVQTPLRSAVPSLHATERRAPVRVAVEAVSPHPGCNNIICGNFMMVGIGF